MSLSNDVELANTRAKLVELEARYKELQRDAGGNEQVRQATLRSLKKYINQFTEEIARYRARQPAQR